MGVSVKVRVKVRSHGESMCGNTVGTLIPQKRDNQVEGGGLSVCRVNARHIQSPEEGVCAGSEHKFFFFHAALDRPD